MQVASSQNLPSQEGTARASSDSHLATDPRGSLPGQVSSSADPDVEQQTDLALATAVQEQEQTLSPLLTWDQHLERSRGPQVIQAPWVCWGWGPLGDSVGAEQRPELSGPRDQASVGPDARSSWKGRCQDQ